MYFHLSPCTRLFRGVNICPPPRRDGGTRNILRLRVPQAFTCNQSFPFYLCQVDIDALISPPGFFNAVSRARAPPYDIRCSIASAGRDGGLRQSEPEESPSSRTRGHLAPFASRGAVRKSRARVSAVTGNPAVPEPRGGGFLTGRAPG